MSKGPQTGRLAPPDINRLLQEERLRWARRPYEFLRTVPSHPEGPLAYYRFRSGRTFFVRLAVVSATEARVELRVTAEEQAGGVGVGRRPAGKEL
ncbi:MAG TPA: hypothetical protein PLR32_03370, partial [candidate division Zixibacteria bacterium]|nr:hypothetical protein [candidate division Zixibacteria bacterium]